MAPVVSNLVDVFEGQVTFVKVNGRQERSLAERYVSQGYPTFVLFKDGELQATHDGAFKDQAAFQAWIEQRL
jgi:thioredoxin 1